VIGFWQMGHKFGFLRIRAFRWYKGFLVSGVYIEISRRIAQFLLQKSPKMGDNGETRQQRPKWSSTYSKGWKSLVPMVSSWQIPWAFMWSNFPVLSSCICFKIRSNMKKRKLLSTRPKVSRHLRQLQTFWAPEIYQVYRYYIEILYSFWNSKIHPLELLNF